MDEDNSTDKTYGIFYFTKWFSYFVRKLFEIRRNSVLNPCLKHMILNIKFTLEFKLMSHRGIDNVEKNTANAKAMSVKRTK